MDRVAWWFTSGGTYYDDDGDVRSVSGFIVKSSSRATRRHMMGEVKAKTSAEFPAAEKSKIDKLQPHNLLHNLAASQDSINGLALPKEKKTVRSCIVEELKAMVIARGGVVTARDGRALRKEELQKIVRAYLSMKTENLKNTVYFNRAGSENGIFATIDTSERKSVPQIIDQLVQCPDFEASLHQFVVHLTGVLESDRFIDDYSTNALEAPELPESFIFQLFVHFGENLTQKNTVSGLTKVIEMDKILYHALAWSEDRKSIYIISKQRASQVRDEKTRNKTADGGFVACFLITNLRGSLLRENVNRLPILRPSERMI